MDIADLRVFEAVARHGSMNRAAAELNTVQSNVTSRMRTLEQKLGVTLFERHARGVSVTPAGQRMLPFVPRIAKLLSDAEAAARDEGEPGGDLMLGSLETTAASRLSPVLSAFAGAYPKVRLVLRPGTTCSLVEDVIDGRLDGAFVAGPLEHPGLEAKPVFREELVLVTARSIASPAALAGVAHLKTIVFRVGCSYRQRLDAVLAEFGLVGATSLEFGSIDAIITCVASGIGITLLPKNVVAAAWQRGDIALHELRPERGLVDTLFIRRRDGYLSSAFAAFLGKLEAVARPIAA